MAWFAVVHRKGFYTFSQAFCLVVNIYSIADSDSGILEFGCWVEYMFEKFFMVNFNELKDYD